MFTNNTPLLAHEAVLLDSVREFTKNADPKDCQSILDELFFNFVSSEASDNMDSSGRAHLVHSYRMLKSLLTTIEQNSKMEVSHD